MNYMHHRYYDPQLGHFLNPDFRAPDIYDPTTFTEPYAYAAGNPMMFWDPDGLAVEEGNLTEDEKTTLIAELAWITGYSSSNIVFSEGRLKVVDRDSFTGGSEMARYLLNLYIDDERAVRFSVPRKRAERAQSFMAQVKDIDQDGFQEKIDFDFADFTKGAGREFRLNSLGKEIRDKGRDLASDLDKTSGVGMTFFHELAHSFIGYVDPRTRRDEETMGLLGATVIVVNQIRSELDLPLRERYQGKLITTDPRSTLFGDSTVSYSLDGSVIGEVKLDMSRMGLWKMHNLLIQFQKSNSDNPVAMTWINQRLAIVRQEWIEMVNDDLKDEEGTQ